jgi:hypothetical protein
MTCGPTASDTTGLGRDSLIDPFSFSATGALAQGFSTWASLCFAPWKAVAVVTEELMRETSGGRD